ncbi:hypothetical protein GCM10027037_26710 [Mucilaginibacter koreensis]
MKLYGYKYVFALLLITWVQLSYGCQQSRVETDNAVTAKPKSSEAAVAQNAAQSTRQHLTDEQLFRQFLQKFKNQVKQRNKAALNMLFYFPLQTDPQWTNEDLKARNVNANEGLINKNQFEGYVNDMFPAEVIKLIALSREDDLSEIERTSPESYYKSLIKVTDKGSRIYELEKQYVQDNGQETSFGFVFGKINGNYKVISYYRPWPLKG